MWNYKHAEELTHHGVMGMKWGVRRWQNKDGSLTAKGKARFAKVESSERLQKKDARAAKSIYYRNRAKAARDYRNNPQELAEWLSVYDKAISDIDTGKVKAGRDFIVQKDYDVWLIGPMISVNTSERIIRK